MTKAPSVEPVVRSRLLPRISFRMMLLLTTLAAILAAIARVADAGNELAMSAMMAFGFVFACFVAFAFLFLFSWSVSVLRKPSGYAALGLATVFGLAALLNVPIPYAANWYVSSFFIVAGLILLFVPVRESDDLVGSPFAKGQLPPQILPPREQRS